MAAALNSFDPKKKSKVSLTIIHFFLPSIIIVPYTMFPVVLIPLALLLPFATVPVSADTYDMVMEYAGQNFFDDWTFFNHCEFYLLSSVVMYLEFGIPVDNLTNGDVVYGNSFGNDIQTLNCI